MSKTLAPITQYLLIAILLHLSGLAGCASNQVKTDQALKLERVGNIVLQVNREDSSLSNQELNQKVTDNLTSWNYPIKLKDTQASHRLLVTVGAITHSSPPSGFSFSAGDSDPRGLDFQKMDVLPIACRLTAISNPEQASELNMGFTAPQGGLQALAIDTLTDHISTVCFNLLQEVAWPIKTASTPTVSHPPSWLPEIRIETKNVDSNGKGKAALEQDGVPKVTVQPSETRKEIIIHNHGSPIILHFGHERK